MIRLIFCFHIMRSGYLSQNQNIKDFHDLGRLEGECPKSEPTLRTCIGISCSVIKEQNGE